MMKEFFISQMDKHYDNVRRLANEARTIIKSIVEENGNMSYEDIYGVAEEDDLAGENIWLDDQQHLVGIELRDGVVYILTANDYDTSTRDEKKLEWLSHSDAMEIADCLCRR